MNVLKFPLSLCFLNLIVACGPAPDMPTYTTSEVATVPLLDNTDQKNFYSLPLRGEVSNGQKYWSGDYWALNKGNVNLRWNSPYQEGFDYVSPSREQVLYMPQEEISRLSATEKFDILWGRYDYPLRADVHTHANRYATDWEGICNGWAPASINHNEPHPKSFTNPDGVNVSFGSSDIKALLSYYYAFIHKEKNTEQLGRRCPRGSGWFNWNADCKNDLNAGSFHIVLANKVGARNQSFMVDIERYKEVWNHPVFSFISRVDGEKNPDRNSPKGTAKVLKIQSKVTYVNESESNSWEPVRGTPTQAVLSRDYVYLLFLDLNNNIIGGEWKSEDRPDFLWTMKPTPQFIGLLTGLEALLND